MVVDFVLAGGNSFTIIYYQIFFLKMTMWGSSTLESHAMFNQYFYHAYNLPCLLMAIKPNKSLRFIELILHYTGM